MVGPKASLTPGNSRITARAMTWAQECRNTSSASLSRSVSTANDASLLVATISRSRSVTTPSTLAATAAWARRLPIDSATSRGRVPGGTSREEPSGSFRVIMVRSRRSGVGPPLRQACRWPGHGWSRYGFGVRAGRLYGNEPGGARRGLELDRVRAGERQDEDLAVAHAAGAGDAGELRHHVVGPVVGDAHGDLDLGQERHAV